MADRDPSFVAHTAAIASHGTTATSVAISPRELPAAAASRGSCSGSSSSPILSAMPAMRILLAPGASGTVERLAPHAEGLRARGLVVELVPLPRGTAERAVPVYRAAAGADMRSSVIGGHSFGGRVASLLAADDSPAALVLLSYPLHAPGRSEAWDARTSHWPLIRCPVLLLSGEADPFARIELLRRAVARLPDATVVTYPRIGHGLVPVLDAALDEIAAFIDAKT